MYKFTLFFLFLTGILSAQVAEDSELFKTLFTQDSLLFNVGFNQCNVPQFDSLTAKDFTMYHDQSGIIPDRETFLAGTENGLCKLDYQPIRKLVQGTLVVYPLHNNGVLYGALQKGIHQFFAKYPDKEMYLTSTAKFTHIWILEDGKWKIHNALSYDHR